MLGILMIYHIILYYSPSLMQLWLLLTSLVMLDFSFQQQKVCNEKSKYN
jgi:hypothetical protein